MWKDSPIRVFIIHMSNEIVCVWIQLVLKMKAREGLDEKRSIRE